MKKLLLVCLCLYGPLLTLYAQSPALVDSALRYKIPSLPMSDAVSIKVSELQEGGDTTEGGEANEFNRQAYFLQNLYSNNAPDDSDALKPAYMSILRFMQYPNDYCSGTGGNWKCTGPYINFYGNGTEDEGRVNYVWTSPSDTNLIFIGTYGGVWKTTNGGQKWKNISDNITVGYSGTLIPGTISVIDMAVDPLNNNNIYVFLADFANIAIGYAYTTDGGNSWQLDNSLNTATGTVLFNTTPPEKLYYMPGTEKLFLYQGSSVFCKSNPSASWQNITPTGYGTIPQFTDLEFDIQHPAKVTLSTIAVQGIADLFTYDTLSTSWSKINVTMPSGYTGDTLIDIGSLSIDAHDTAYMLVDDTSATHAHYQSLIKTPVSIANEEMINLSEGGYQYLVVNPNNTTVMYATTHNGYNNFYQSVNGGISFDYYSADNGIQGNTHADARHILLYSATTSTNGINDVLYGATDGGIVKKRAGSYTFQSITGDSLCIPLLFGLSDVEGEDDMEMGGAQDNGKFTYSENRATPWVSNDDRGDNYKPQISRRGSKNALAEADFPGLYKVTIGGSESDIPTPNLYDTCSSDWWNVCNNAHRPWYVDTSNNFYIGYRYVWKGDATGSSWAKAFPTSDPFDTVSKYTVGPCAIKMWDRDNNIAYIAYSGSGDGSESMDSAVNKRLWYSKNALSPTPSWTSITPSIAAWYPITDIDIDPVHPGRIWAAIGAVDWDTYTQPVDQRQLRVQYSPDTGKTWYDVSAGLSALPVNKILYQHGSKDILYCGTELGVYRCDFSTFNPNDPPYYDIQWQCFNNGMPLCVVTDMEINYCANKLRISTLGRGFWQSDLPPVTPMMDTVKTNTTWSSNQYLESSVDVKPGVRLTILNNTVHMPKNGLITVEPGGRLIIDSAVITNNCDSCMWGGIEALGHSTSSQDILEQAWVTIEKGSVIENARTGVANWNAADSDVATTGGVIQAINSSFIDNHVAASFNTYHNYHGTTLLPNLSSFQNCKFLTDNNYKGDSATYPFSADAWLMGVEGIAFRGDSFLNRNTVSADRGTGIYSYNSGFSVQPYCSGIHYINTCPSSIHSQFTGFLNGIYASGDVSLDPTINVDQTDFDSSSIGIYESNISSLSATRNQFMVGDAPTVNDVEYGNCNENIGIYSQNCPQFRIEQNSFEAPDNAATSFGVAVLNSGPNDKVVYRNSFTQLTYACFAQGVNSNYTPPGSDLPPLPTGLTFKCNNYTLNKNDIVVGSDNNLYHGIKQYQGSDTSVGNVFNDGGIVINNGAYFVYSYKENDEQPAISGSSTTTYASLADYDNSCTATFPNTPTVSPVTLGNATISGYEKSLTAGKMTYSDSLRVYNGLIDNGNTPSYITTLQREKDSTGQITLLNATSPFVSYQSLLALKKEPLVSRSRYLSILTDNPEVLRDSINLSNLVAADNDLFKVPVTPTEISTLIAASYTSTRNSSLSASIRDAHEQMVGYTGLLLMAMKVNNDSDHSVADSSGDNICTDTTSMYYGLDSNSCFNNLDSVVTCLQNTGELWAQYDIAGYYNYTGQLRLMNDLIAAIPDSFTLDTAQTNEYNDYDTIINILTTLKDSGKTVNQLDPSQIVSLTNISALVSANKAAVTGGTILNINNAHTYPLLPCSLILVTGRMLNNSSNQQGPGDDKQQNFGTVPPVSNLRLNAQVSAYPNPANDRVIFKYSVPDATGKITLSITNAIGLSIAVITTTDNNGQIVWETGNIAAGVYLYGLSDDSGLIATGRIIIVR